MRRRLCLFPLFLMGSVMLAWGCAHTEEASAPVAEEAKPEPQRALQPSFKLLETVGGEANLASPEAALLKVNPGSEAQALDYYKKIRAALVDFPKPTLTDSYIADMLAFYGFPALLAEDLEALAPAILMDFKRLAEGVSNKPDFEKAYRGRRLQPGEILATRFFAPKIVNVRDPQTAGVPNGGFGWRKVLRFRARQDSKARAVGLDSFYLLFNFTTNQPKFPEGIHAGQIQALLVPTYPTGGKHNDIYFLVYQGLGTATPGQVGLFLRATFDLAGVVPEDKYYVPTSCGQCHGTEVENQPGGKVNYLDTDHWIDRTGDDFQLVQAADVLVDGVPQAYDTFRLLNREIEQQNAAVITKPTDAKFALLAVRKWLELHKETAPDANRHVPALRRGFAENAGDPVWTAGGDPDEKLLPLLNQYCFRCHSSVRYHVFQKAAVIKRKASIVARVNSGNMPQDRQLDGATKTKLLDLLKKLP